MAEKAKILNHDGTQDVRLPESVRFPEDLREVTVRRDGTRVILEPVAAASSSDAFWATFGAWDEEIERPPQTPITELKDPFD